MKAEKQNQKNKNNLKKALTPENLWNQKTKKIRNNIVRISTCIILMQDSDLVYKLAYDTVKKEKKTQQVVRCHRWQNPPEYCSC